MTGELAGAERFALAELPARPWKNGGGVTREIAVAPRGAGHEDFDWRLSVAEIERDGPFSSFDGVDRQIVLLRGAGLRLHEAATGASHALAEPGVAHAFAGEAPVVASLIDGPTQDLNVMLRRGVWQADVQSHRTDASLPGADARLLLVCAGTWRIDAADVTPAHGLLWRAATGPILIAPTAGTGAWAVVVRLCQHRRS